MTEEEVREDERRRIVAAIRARAALLESQSYAAELYAVADDLEQKIL